MYYIIKVVSCCQTSSVYENVEWIFVFIFNNSGVYQGSGSVKISQIWITGFAQPDSGSRACLSLPWAVVLLMGRRGRER